MLDILIPDTLDKFHVLSLYKHRLCSFYSSLQLLTFGEKAPGSRAMHPYKEEIREEEASKDEQGAPGQTEHKHAASRGWKQENMSGRNIEEPIEQSGIML